MVQGSLALTSDARHLCYISPRSTRLGWARLGWARMSSARLGSVRLGSARLVLGRRCAVLTSLRPELDFNQVSDVIITPNASSVCYASRPHSSVLQTADDVPWNMIHAQPQTPSAGLRHPSFGGRCRKAMLGVWLSPSLFQSRVEPSAAGIRPATTKCLRAAASR